MWGIVEGTQLLARVVHQGVDEDLLGLTMGGPGHGHPGVAGEPLGAPQWLPVRRAVARAGEARRIDECFREHNRIAIAVLKEQ